MNSNSVVNDPTVSQALLYVPFLSETVGLVQCVYGAFKMDYYDDPAAAERLFKASYINLTAGQTTFSLVVFAVHNMSQLR